MKPFVGKCIRAAVSLHISDIFLILLVINYHPKFLMIGRLGLQMVVQFSHGHSYMSVIMATQCAYPCVERKVARYVHSLLSGLPCIRWSVLIVILTRLIPFLELA